MQSSDGHLTRTAHANLGISPRNWRLVLFVCVLFVFREVRDTAGRNLSRVQTGKRRGRGELLPPPSSVSRLTSLFTKRKRKTPKNRLLRGLCWTL